MQMRIWSILLVAVLILAGASRAGAQTPAPWIFFTDLTSGPNTGGESVSGYAGAYVTLYGNYFGATAPSVTLNGASCVRVVGTPVAWLWYQKLSVQLGAACATGNFVVTTTNGTSNGKPFTVRSGNIHCVSTAGNDNNPGTFSGGCWRTVVQGRHISPGDITYVENGVVQNTTDGFADLTIGTTGTAADPIALVTYPGASATIGDTTTNDGIRFCTYYSSCGTGGSFWTIAGFTLLGHNAALSISDGVNNLSFIGNDISCPNGDGFTACVTANANVGSTLSFIYLYGNNIHNAGKVGAVKEYHTVYLSTNVNHDFVAWNSVHDSHGCRGIQFYSTGGVDQYDLHVHDNLIHDIPCDGINFSTVNPSVGPVEAYNNVIYNAGQGPDPGDGASNYSCIRVSGTSNTTPAEIYNNTMYNCGSRALAGGSGVMDLEEPTHLRNNISYSTSSNEPYFFGTNCSNVTGQNNLWFGAGTPPCTLTSNLNVDPQLTNPSIGNFNLSSAASPPNGAGIAVSGLNYDFAGLPRPSPPAIGVHQYTYIPRPAPPTNLTVTVN